MAGGFANPLTGSGGTLVLPRIKSPNYISGSDGWAVKRDGTAEFNSATFRGQITLGGISPNAREVIGASPVPAELVTYYNAGSPATFIAPETVVTVTIEYDGNGNYAYQAMVIDSSAPQVTSVAFGINIGGTVAEVSRVTLNPSGGGSSNTFYEHAKVTMHTGAGTDVTFVVLAASKGSDINADRWQLRANGTVLLGPGGTNVNPDTVGMARSAAATLIADQIAYNAGTTTSPSAETWHSPALLNGWTNRGAGFPNAGYKRLVIDNAVMLVGQVTPGTLLDNTVLFNVPAGYRPATKIAFAVAGAAGQPAAVLNVATNGDVSILNGAAVTQLQFSHVYPLDR